MVKNVQLNSIIFFCVWFCANFSFRNWNISSNRFLSCACLIQIEWIMDLIKSNLVLTFLLVILLFVGKRECETLEQTGKFHFTKRKLCVVLRFNWFCLIVNDYRQFDWQRSRNRCDRFSQRGNTKFKRMVDTEFDRRGYEQNKKDRMRFTQIGRRVGKWRLNLKK